MALIGNYTKYWLENDPEEVREVVVTYPSILPQQHPDYDKRGVTETIIEPVTVQKTETWEDVYIVIRTYAIEKEEIPHFEETTMETPDDVITPIGLEKGWRMSIRFAVYANKEDKLTSPENYILQDHAYVDLPPMNESIFKLGYSSLKQVKGFEETQNDE